MIILLYLFSVLIFAHWFLKIHLNNYLYTESSYFLIVQLAHKAVFIFYISTNELGELSYFRIFKKILKFSCFSMARCSSLLCDAWRIKAFFHTHFFFLCISQKHFNSFLLGLSEIFHFRQNCLKQSKDSFAEKICTYHEPYVNHKEKSEANNGYVFNSLELEF